MRSKCAKFYAFTVRGTVTGVPCGQWSCSDCAKQQARLWAWRVRLHVNNHRNTPTYFCTFTLPPKYATPYQGFKALPGLWDGYRRAMQKAIKTSCFAGLIGFSYCAFVEGQPHRSYMPHFHVLQFAPTPRITGRIVQPIKDFAVSMGFGYQANEQIVSGPAAASYVAKYASKQSPFTPKGFRRVRVSQDWQKLPEAKFPALIVKSRNETTSEYIIRVHDVSGVGLDDLLDRWRIAHGEDLW